MYDPASALTGLQAISEAHPENAAIQAAISALADIATDAKYDRAELTITVAREDILAACRAVKPVYNFFEDATAVDWYPSEPRFQITYHLLSLSLKARLRLIVQLDGSDAVLDSIVSVWPAANFYEREIFDLFGVRFSGHPNMVRIMMPEDWQGHPLRKDYPVEGYR
ncbi:NADH-quinone oxidoreductase subunit C [Granulicella arctica]|uniref:NADH-quinone oxidoreductase subunit C n=1 Tax=Granulicella arctica TaxID=940613 RepID=A0A7Y9PHY0_9BACT|nr:NADH-quinone oxidoreductase subunit C [Granulicella arctica]NYF80224.1 NADH-quinone oxidoreductase subunit C [Granulicella arctica]